jgi:class 3 adenylate cyclase
MSEVGAERKVVSVLFADLVGSTELGEATDPEALRTKMRRYFADIRATIERHGGTVEKFIGDAVMAVFGVPVAREDDALRAVRSAVEIRDAVVAHGFEARIGVNTGEVVAGSEDEALVVGDAVNVAARLEQAAAPGEILIEIRRTNSCATPFASRSSSRSSSRASRRRSRRSACST